MTCPRKRVNSSQAQTLTYDQANRLTKFAAASTTSYGYNGDGLRMCKYAGSSNQPCQATGNTAYLWDVASSLPVMLKDGSSAYIYGPGGLPLEQVNTGATYWYHHDQLGSTRLVTNSTATTPHPASYTYDPYGGIASISESITNPLRFFGQYQDSESGLYYLRARFYDPTTAQFLSADPAVAATAAPYSYVSGSPLSRSDPSGMDGNLIEGPRFAVQGFVQAFGPVVGWTVQAIRDKSKWVTGSFTFYVDDARGNRVQRPQIVVVGPFDQPSRRGIAACNSGTWTIGVKFGSGQYSTMDFPIDCSSSETAGALGLLLALIALLIFLCSGEPGVNPVPRPGPVPVPVF